MIRVLIADDEYIMRQGLKYMINWEQEGYEIVGEATNGQEALKMAGELMPHIIISDIVMPVLDGVDFSEAIHKMYPAMSIIILSGYDNFEYVKQTLMSGVVDYILKPTLNPEELLKALQKASSRIPGYKLVQDVGTVSYGRMMERYLLGLSKELDEGKFRSYFTYSKYRIYAVNIRKTNQNGQDLSNLLYKKIEREVKGEAKLQKLMIMLREELVCIVFCVQMQQNRELTAFIEQLNAQLVLLCGNVLGVCSRWFEGIEQIYAVFQQDIIGYADKGFYYKNTRLLFAEEEEQQFKANIKFDFFQYNYYLEERQFLNAVKSLETYNETALNARMDSYKLKNQMKNMTYHYLDVLRIEDSLREARRYQYFKMIDQAEYEADYRETSNIIWEQLLELSGEKQPQNDERIEKILEYISLNYREDLKLETLSEKFSFNYHYLSVYFSQQVQEGFSEYLNRIRIAKACQLLKDSRSSIAEISGEVGYSDHSYFSRVFKKITGKTPSEWRRSQNYDE